MKLEDCRKKMKLTNKEFARLLMISESALCNYIHKRRKPRLDIAQRIVKITKMVTIEDLLK